jgi:hypothetical protein
MALRHRGGADIQPSSFLTSELDGSEWSTSHPSHFTYKKEPSTKWKRRLGRPQEPGCTCWRREKSLALLRIQIPDCPACSLTTVPTALTPVPLTLLIMNTYLKCRTREELSAVVLIQA